MSVTFEGEFGFGDGSVENDNVAVDDDLGEGGGVFGVDQPRGSSRKREPVAYDDVGVHIVFVVVAEFLDKRCAEEGIEVFDEDAVLEGRGPAVVVGSALH